MCQHGQLDSSYFVYDSWNLDSETLARPFGVELDIILKSLHQLFWGSLC